MRIGWWRDEQVIIMTWRRGWVRKMKSESESEMKSASVDDDSTGFESDLSRIIQGRTVSWRGVEVEN